MKNFVLLITAITFLTSQQLDAAAKPREHSAKRQPLTFGNVTSFFQDALRRAPLKVYKRCSIFSEGEWTNANWYNHSVIVVEKADEDVEVTFIMTGDEGMNWVNEFLDSPFFQRSETESLFQLLNNGHGTRRAKVGRFAVELSRWQPRHHEIVVLSLTPRKR